MPPAVWGQRDLAADLLETDDPARAEELARQLCDLNRERQAVEQAICADATAKIEKLRAEERSALVLSSEDWHQGVVGIVASRLSEKYSCPSFMIHLKDGVGKGSVPVLRRAEPSLRRWNPVRICWTASADMSWRPGSPFRRRILRHSVPG